MNPHTSTYCSVEFTIYLRKSSPYVAAPKENNWSKFQIQKLKSSCTQFLKVNVFRVHSQSSQRERERDLHSDHLGCRKHSHSHLGLKFFFCNLHLLPPIKRAFE
ncbi:hypothetical protein VNO78_06099 [Psophocarpus tetragonolobus]|uniref:Uncharacterized protein n=1 Tax=Psophocarpus tetragonolobus TaxID=3891 RepID=A0AAN9SUP2_PSOTE